jgi:long-chain acyl-CoA synthetase
MLVDALLTSASRSPGRIAVSDPRMRLSYRRLVAASIAFRDIARKETRKERIGIMLPASAGFSAALFGSLWAGKTVVPLNFLLGAAELQQVVDDAGIDLVLSVHYFDDLLAQLPVRPLALEDIGLKRKVIWSLLRRRPRVPDVKPNDLAVLLYTSGTAGEPKGVELTYENLRSNCVDSIATAQMTSDHKLLNILPPFHVFGLTANVLIPVVLGGTSHCLPRFQPAAVVRAMIEERPSIFMAIPSMYAALLRMKSAPPDTYSNLYLAITGGEPLHQSILDGFRERFGVDLLQGYGLTETSPVVALNLPGASRDGTIGKPIRNVEVRIADEAGQEAPPDTDGEVWIRGPCVMRGYHNRPDLTAAAITPDGWLRTGDMGRRDADGFLSITGRIKDMIIVGGENVFPDEIEAVLLEHPAVAEVAVIGVPDPSRGEVASAFVVCREDHTAEEAELRSFVRDRLAGFKVPRSVHFAKDLPRGPTGKVNKQELRKNVG